MNLTTTPAAPRAADAPVLALTMGTGGGMARQFGPAVPNPLVAALDVYDLDQIDLSTVSGIVVGMNVDQVHLERRAEKLTAFVRDGGRVAVTGHPVVRFLEGMGDFRTLDYAGDVDLAITAGDPHPVWDGVDLADASARRGVTGFYARGYTQDHPEGAIITTRIGRTQLPADYVYPLGAGWVLIHPGIEFGVFAHDGNSAARLHPQLIDWLVAR